MQITHVRNQFHLHWGKVSLFVGLLFVILTSSATAQGMFGMSSLSGSDDKLLSYGFFIGIHTNTYRLKYSDAFMDETNPASPMIRAIYPKYTPGFSLGFTGIFRFHDQLRLLFAPKIGFYQFQTEVQFFPQSGNTPQPGGIDEEIDLSGEVYFGEATLVELPILLKYSSQRFNNTRMYFIGGASYQFRTKPQDQANLEDLVTTGQDYTLEIGMGFESYFQFFKFAPEIRFSHGLKNLYQPQNTNPFFNDAISDIRRKSITLYLNFQ